MSQRKLYIPEEFYEATSWREAKSLRQNLDMAKARLLVVACTFILAFLVITFRLVDVSLIRGIGEGHKFARSPHGTSFRADIVDRNGELLATSLTTSSLYANAKVVIDPKEAAEKLAHVLPELNHQETMQKLKSGKVFIWLARHLTPQKQAEIMRLGIPGLYFRSDERRVYPHGELFSHILGYTNIDNEGLGGVERKFDHYLLSETSSLQLSLDLRVQHALRDELLEGIEKFHAEGGAGMIMDVRSGEVLAMVSLPDFDPNQVGKIGSQKDALFNRITLGAYEMGSSFKIFNTALFLESKIASITTKFDVSAPLRLGRFKITDYHPVHYPLTVAEIFTISSNIGAAKMAMQIGSERQTQFFKELGFFEASSLEISEIGAPIFPKNWSEATTITASYGYGISISPLQLVTAIAGIVNKGMMNKPTLLKKENPQRNQGIQIVSKETSEIMCQLMHTVVAEGTGKKARVKNYEVGGKTGTANLLSGKSYKQGSNMTSFVGAFPMSRPEYIVLIMVDRPQAIKETYGFNAAGWNAAPIAGKVISRIAPLLQVIPVNEATQEASENPQFIHAKATHEART
jgi:cell division protein FtsI (penicillin-binding protein 3)